MTSKFVEELILTHKNSAASASQACEQLRDMMVLHRNMENNHNNHNNNNSSSSEKGKQILISFKKNIMNDDNNNNNMNHLGQKSATGPLLFPGSTLYEALVAIEKYNSEVAERDAYEWRMASKNINNNNSNNNQSSGINEGVLTSIINNTKKNHVRAERRERALINSQEHLAEAESNLRSKKETSKKLWNKVSKVEEDVNRKVEEKMRQRSRDRELKRRKEETERQAAMSDAQLNSMVTQQEIMVSIYMCVYGMK